MNGMVGRNKEEVDEEERVLVHRYDKIQIINKNSPFFLFFFLNSTALEVCKLIQRA